MPEEPAVEPWSVPESPARSLSVAQGRPDGRLVAPLPRTEERVLPFLIQCLHELLHRKSVELKDALHRRDTVEVRTRRLALHDCLHVLWRLQVAGPRVFKVRARGGSGPKPDASARRFLAQVRLAAARRALTAGVTAEFCEVSLGERIETP